MAPSDDPLRQPDEAPPRPVEGALDDADDEVESRHPDPETRDSPPRLAGELASGGDELASDPPADGPEPDELATQPASDPSPALPARSTGEEPPLTPDPTPSPDERHELLTSPDTACLNCGKALPGAYCPSCGQKAGPLRQPVHHFVRDAFLEFFGIDGRIWPTLWALLAKPGTLTREYLAGRRQTFLRPLRVYLVSTLSFFFLLSLIDPVGRAKDDLFVSDALSDSVRVADELARVDSLLAAGFVGLDDERAGVVEARRAVDSLRAGGAQAPSVGSSAAPDLAEGELADAEDGLAEALSELASDSANVASRLLRYRVQRAVLETMPPDSLILADGVRGAATLVYPDSAAFFGDGDDPDWLLRSESIQSISGAATNAQRVEALARFARTVIGYVPTVLFLILPIFAFLLKLMYVRRGWYYSEHLIFGLHTHAFAFVVFSILTVFILAVSGLTGSAKAWGWVGINTLLVTIPVYFFVAQKRVYGQGWIKTAVKALLLASVYNTVLMFGLGAVFVIAAYFG